MQLRDKRRGVYGKGLPAQWKDGDDQKAPPGAGAVIIAPGERTPPGGHVIK
jgi:hypothetical protein